MFRIKLPEPQLALMHYCIKDNHLHINLEKLWTQLQTLVGNELTLSTKISPTLFLFNTVSEQNKFK